MSSSIRAVLMASAACVAQGYDYRCDSLTSCNECASIGCGWYEEYNRCGQRVEAYRGPLSPNQCSAAANFNTPTATATAQATNNFDQYPDQYPHTYNYPNAAPQYPANPTANTPSFYPNPTNSGILRS
jgi:hypothetical protein